MRAFVLALVSVAVAFSALGADSPKKESSEYTNSGIITVPFRLQQSDTGPVLAPAYPEKPLTGTEDLKGFKYKTLPSIGDMGISAAQVVGNRSQTEIWLSVAVLVFGLLVIAGEVIVMWRQKQPWEASSIRIVGLSLIVILGVFLITSGYSQTQIAPLIGLFGAIVGYLLGKTDPKP